MNDTSITVLNDDGTVSELDVVETLNINGNSYVLYLDEDNELLASRYIVKNGNMMLFELSDEEEKLVDKKWNELNEK